MNQARATDHLSIGEVLSLVREDFPDVTISKIRFLESQGLIAPERTASGYRKFFEADIDRLRWILRQQRDHFLPLKVIKRMLDQGVDLAEGDGAQTTLFGDEAAGGQPAPAVEPRDGEQRSASSRSAAHPAVQSARQSQSARRNGPSSRAVSSSAGVPDGPGAAPSTQSRSSTTSRAARAEGARRPSAGDDADAGPPVSAGEPSSSPETTASAQPPPEQPSTEQSAAVGSPSTSVASGSASSPEADHDDPSPSAGAPAPSSPARPSHATPADVVAALQEHPPGARRRRDPAVASAAAPSGGTAAPAVAGRVASSLFAERASGVRLSREELLDATGIDDELLDGLIRYGLIVAVPLDSDPTYDQDAVEIARIGRRCAELGIDPRHLRMYKVAAEREAGVLEQLAAPLVRQRNPDARRQATERVEEIAAMGAELHATLLRRHLGPVVGQ